MTSRRSSLSCDPRSREGGTRKDTGHAPKRSRPRAYSKGQQSFQAISLWTKASDGSLLVSQTKNLVRFLEKRGHDQDGQTGSVCGRETSGAGSLVRSCFLESVLGLQTTSRRWIRVCRPVFHGRECSVTVTPGWAQAKINKCHSSGNETFLDDIEENESSGVSFSPCQRRMEGRLRLR